MHPITIMLIWTLVALAIGCCIGRWMSHCAETRW